MSNNLKSLIGDGEDDDDDGDLFKKSKNLSSKYQK